MCLPAGIRNSVVRNELRMPLGNLFPNQLLLCSVCITYELSLKWDTQASSLTSTAFDCTSMILQGWTNQIATLHGGGATPSPPLGSQEVSQGLPYRPGITIMSFSAQQTRRLAPLYSLGCELPNLFNPIRLSL